MSRASLESRIELVRALSDAMNTSPEDFGIDLLRLDQDACWLDVMGRLMAASEERCAADPGLAACIPITRWP